jgi:hypothetical protein
MAYREMGMREIFEVLRRVHRGDAALPWSYLTSVDG